MAKDPELARPMVTLQLAADDHLPTSINAVNLKDHFAISRPIVVIACMFGSSKSGEL